MTEITLQFLEKIQNNKKIRQVLAYEHPLWFSMLYLRHHFGHPLAPFHIEMFHLIHQESCNFIAVMAFRESGKSTIMNTANVLWSILGKPEKKFAIIIGKTQEQAKNHFLNIKAELENNELLKEDFGPFVEDDNDLKRLSLELVYHGSKIMSVTPEQGIRGLKYGPYRPDLIICDDMEDVSVVFNHKESDVLYERFEKEIIPVGSSRTRVIVLGNLLSRYSFMVRLKSDIDEGRMSGVFRVYPLLDDKGKILWLSKFLNSEKIKELRNKLSEETWHLEYLLTFGNSMHFEKPPTALPNPLDKDNYTRALSLRCKFKHAQIENRYRKILCNSKPQKDIISQMDEFRISAPANNSIAIREPNDPLYEMYQKYEGEIRNIEIEYKDEIMRAIRVRAMRAYRDAKEAQEIKEKENYMNN